MIFMISFQGENAGDVEAWQSAIRDCIGEELERSESQLAAAAAQRSFEEKKRRKADEARLAAEKVNCLMDRLI